MIRGNSWGEIDSVGGAVSGVVVGRFDFEARGLVVALGGVMAFLFGRPLWGRALQVGAVVLSVSACARMHHYQLGDIDSTHGTLEPFEVQVDETGVNLHEAVSVAKAFSDDETDERLDTAEDVIALFQVGPSTGDPTFSDDWADDLLVAIRKRCPSGRVTGVTTVRESNDYPVVSGEIVTIKGYCIR